jgi:Transposase DDE domain/Transposase domain (DUF772)
MLRPMRIEAVPPQTARVAHAAFPKGNRYLKLADEMETLFTDDTFQALFPTHGQPALPPWRLALVTLLQFAEGLSDRQAADAVRSRIDWNYVLRIELTDAGFDAIDWDRQHATCPAGKASISWAPRIDTRGNPLIQVRFSTKDCRRCDHAAQCIHSTKRYPRRTITVRPQPPYQALQAARQREAADAFRAEYARRAGLEGTISRGTRAARLRRTRYRGLARVHLGHILTAVGLNILRLGEWLLEMARAKTRLTPFARLMANAPTA